MFRIAGILGHDAAERVAVDDVKRGEQDIDGDVELFGDCGNQTFGDGFIRVAHVDELSIRVESCRCTA